VAEDNLRLGRDVIGDCVNDWAAARDGWQAAGERAGARLVWLQVVCSDAREHRHRVDTRASETPGLALPDWAAVTARDYHAWDRDGPTLDTAQRSLAECVEAALAACAP